MLQIRNGKKLIELHPAQILFFGFAAIILLGALTLILPISTQSGHSINFIDALFESTSAVCVTGLAVVDTGQTFTLFGQIALLILIQIGGWGWHCPLLCFSSFSCLWGLRLPQQEEV